MSAICIRFQTLQPRRDDPRKLPNINVETAVPEAKRVPIFTPQVEGRKTEV